MNTASTSGDLLRSLADLGLRLQSCTSNGDIHEELTNWATEFLPVDRLGIYRGVRRMTPLYSWGIFPNGERITMEDKRWWEDSPASDDQRFQTEWMQTPVAEENQEVLVLRFVRPVMASGGTDPVTAEAEPAQLAASLAGRLAGAALSRLGQMRRIRFALETRERQIRLAREATEAIAGAGDEHAPVRRVLLQMLMLLDMPWAALYWRGAGGDDFHLAEVCVATAEGPPRLPAVLRGGAGELVNVWSEGEISRQIPGLAIETFLLRTTARVSGCMVLPSTPGWQQEGGAEFIQLMAHSLGILLDKIELIRELEARGSRLEAANVELRALDQIKTNLLATISHELRSPLVSILGYTELMLGEELGPLTSEQRRGLEVSHKNIRMLVDLIENLIFSARRQRDMERINPEPMDLARAVRDAADVFAARPGAGPLVVDCPEALFIRGDAAKIHRMLINLIDNAIKFSRPGEPVEVKAFRKNRHGWASVRDHGVGISMEDQRRVFEMFFQADSSPRRRHGGAGIGLYVVKQIVDLHQGQIELESLPGEGSEFRAGFPLIDPDPPPPVRKRKSRA